MEVLPWCDLWVVAQHLHIFGDGESLLWDASLDWHSATTDEIKSSHRDFTQGGINGTASHGTNTRRGCRMSRQISRMNLDWS